MVTRRPGAARPPVGPSTRRHAEAPIIADRFTLEGQVAIVTGAGRGLGAAIARALAEAGADMVISARTTEQLKAVATAIEHAGRKALAVPADLSDLDAAAGLAEAAHDTFGRIDVVVNNVGGALPRPFLDTSPRFLAETFHFNVLTAHALTRAAVPRMLDHGGGTVLNISSALGRFAARGFLGYGVAKAALAHYTRMAAADLAPRIRVNAIAVGSAATSALDVVTETPELLAQMEALTPLRRIGTPDEVAATALWLVSPAGAYVTGKIIEVDGGIQQPNLDMGLPDL